LTSPLQYQPGPYGNYYLTLATPPTPLYHAGSRGADSAGLFHYTSFADQTKEGAGQMVNIGLHYVATAGAGSTQPNDADRDGIPDYVENRHGDGRTDSPEETNWQTDASTQGHAYDPLYDDIDLSGNGLVGRIKKALGVSPLDSGNPLSLR